VSSKGGLRSTLTLRFREFALRVYRIEEALVEGITSRFGPGLRIFLRPPRQRRDTGSLGTKFRRKWHGIDLLRRCRRATAGPLWMAWPSRLG
jgi:hypothetical protein